MFCLDNGGARLSILQYFGADSYSITILYVLKGLARGGPGGPRPPQILCRKNTIVITGMVSQTDKNMRGGGYWLIADTNADTLFKSS